MQTCTRCQAQSPDDAERCTRCGADLSQASATAVALARLRASERVARIRLVVAPDCCPACQAVEGQYEKDRVPHLPVNGCSHALGCRCFYAPALSEIYP